MASEAPAARPRPLIVAPRRRVTVEVAIGEVVIGGRRPIAVQSMTTTKTADAQATAAQVAALARAGCDIVRVTVPGRPDARALPAIRQLLARDGVAVPLVADIHFTPRLALDVVEHVEKVRVNPGNFSDRRSLTGEAYDDSAWDRDVERAYGAFAPLADRARELGVALRIGVNHGSLSDRMVFRFGDSPLGMVESALEFVRFAEDRGHRGLVVSMKASIPHVMVRAYRLLAARLDAAGQAYPLHLGVTEAGGGDEGRMKSAAGIATLLADGLGDTVRVSLTEDPLHEVPVGRHLVRLFARDGGGADEAAGVAADAPRETRDPFDPLRRPTTAVACGGLTIGGDAVPAVELVVPAAGGPPAWELLAARPRVDLVDVRVEAPGETDGALALLRQIPVPDGPARGVTLAPGAWRALAAAGEAGAARLEAGCERVALVVDGPEDVPAALATVRSTPRLVLLALRGELARELWRIEAFAAALAGAGTSLSAGLIPARETDAIVAVRALAAALDAAGCRAPIVLSAPPVDGTRDEELLATTGRLGSPLVDGLGDAVRVEVRRDAAAAALLAHGVLQAAGRRLERAEFIACPSCGRTLFDLERTTERVRELTKHLKLKIAVMGCIVNGPGEMADADFGYVGWGEGKVALFVGREMVERDIPFAEAPERLVALIRERGRWTDPEPEPDDAAAKGAP